MKWRECIKFVLVNPTHPGNIGSAARALKNMGLNQLILVDPVTAPDERAYALASGAEDILQSARTVSTLAEALDDCQLVLATSSRERRLTWPMVTPKQAASQLANMTESAEIAFIFGRERTGLTNEELQWAHQHLWVPANPDYPSLNLAGAIQIIAYELFQALAEHHPPKKPNNPHKRLATERELRYFYDHLQQVLSQVGFLNRNNPKLLMQRMVRLFNRAQLDQHELNILRGILSAVQSQNYSDSS